MTSFHLPRLANWLVALVLLIPAQGSFAQAVAQERTWSTVDGKFSVKASFVALEKKEVKLRKRDGKEISVPLKKLSFADHKFIAAANDLGRVWKDESGKKKPVVAEFVSSNGKTVKLKPLVGKVVRFKVETLDAESKAFLAAKEKGFERLRSAWRGDPGAPTMLDIRLDVAASDAEIRKRIAFCEERSRGLRIDGRASDWQDLPTFPDDTQANDPAMDIVRVGIAPREKDLVVMFQTRGKPTTRDWIYFLRVDFMDQSGGDFQLSLSRNAPLAVKVFDKANKFKVLADTKLQGGRVAIGDAVEVQIPWRSVAAILPANMSGKLVGENARPHVRVEVFSYDRASRKRADNGPTVGSYRFLRSEYPLDAKAPGEIRKSLPIKVPFEGKWYVLNGAMGYAGHVGIHAYDFMIVDRTLSRASPRSSTNNNDHYCFGRPLLCPVDSIVLKVKGKEPDGIPFKKERKPSNFAWLTPRGHGDLALAMYHLKQNGVSVRPGQKLKRGEVVGECGNSGHSTAAHLHLQLEQPKLQSQLKTLPLTFERAIVSLNPAPNDPWTRYVENWEIRAGVFVERPSEGQLKE